MLTGMIETGLHDWNDETGRCFVLFGTMVPNEIGDGLVSSGFAAPSFGMIAAGQYLDDVVNECDTDQITSTGYQWILDAEVTVGTVYPFFTEFFVPGEAQPEAVVAGRPTSSDAAYFSPDLTDTIEAADPSSSTDTSTQTLPLVGSSFTWSELGTTWEVVLTGMIETGLHDWNDETGRCFVLFGTMVPNEIGDGLVSSGFAAPSFGMIAAGQYLDDVVNECDTDQITSTGYQWILDAEVTVGTVYPFFTEFFVPGEAQPEAVVAGRPTSSDAAYFSPDLTDTIEAADPSSSTDTSTQTLPLVGSSFTWSELGTTWEVVLTGMIETGLHDWNDETGRCFVLFGTMVPNEIGDGLVSSGFAAPSFGMIAAGQYLDDVVNECDTDQITSTGYQWILDAEVTVGTVYPFFTEFFVPGEAQPEAVVAGRPTSSDAAYFSPDLTDTIEAP